jgi:hypothetical protein
MAPKKKTESGKRPCEAPPPNSAKKPSPPTTKPSYEAPPGNWEQPPAKEAHTAAIAAAYKNAPWKNKDEAHPNAASSAPIQAAPPSPSPPQCSASPQLAATLSEKWAIAPTQAAAPAPEIPKAAQHQFLDLACPGREGMVSGGLGMVRE